MFGGVAAAEDFLPATFSVKFHCIARAGLSSLGLVEENWSE